MPCDPIATVIIKDKGAIATAVDVRRGPSGADGGNQARDILVPSSGQTSFNLTSAIANPSLSRVFLNGQKVTYGLSYGISASGTVLNWIGDYNLESDDTLEIYYQFP